jgi:hypothetical protein
MLNSSKSKEQLMKTIGWVALAAAMLLAAEVAPAQPGPGGGSGAGASAPQGGPGGHGGMGGRWSSDYTPGWSMMTPQERQEHQDRMRSMSTYADCKAYVDQHHQQMADRAKANAQSIPAQPHRDACAGLKH